MFELNPKCKCDITIRTGGHHGSTPLSHCDSPPGSAPWNFSGKVRFEAHSELLKIPGIWDTISTIKHNITQFWWKELSLTRFYWFSKLNSDVQDSNWDLVWNMRSRAKFYPDSYVGSFYWDDFITTLKPLVTLKVDMSLSNVSVLKTFFWTRLPISTNGGILGKIHSNPPQEEIIKTSWKYAKNNKRVWWTIGSI